MTIFAREALEKWNTTRSAYQFDLVEHVMAVRTELYSIPGFELKARYQRNMLWSLGIVCLLAAVFALYLKLTETDRLRTATTGTGESAVQAGSVIKPEVKKPNTAQNGLGYNPYERQHRGFAGFRGYRVIHDLSISTHDAESSIIAAYDPIPPSSESRDPFTDAFAETGFGSVEPESDLNYLPDEPVRTLIMDRNVQVVRRVDPEYPAVALERGIEGEIAVIVYIDSSGRLSSYPDWLQGSFKSMAFSVNGQKRIINYAISEQPPDWFFGRNFLKVLPQWEFLPKIEQGVAVGSVLTIRYYYCLGAYCLKYEILSAQ